MQLLSVGELASAISSRMSTNRWRRVSNAHAACAGCPLSPLSDHRREAASQSSGDGKDAGDGFAAF